MSMSSSKLLNRLVFHHLAGANSSAAGGLWPRSATCSGNAFSIRMANGSRNQLHPFLAPLINADNTLAAVAFVGRIGAFGAAVAATLWNAQQGPDS